jgi:hypothetical protein
MRLTLFAVLSVAAIVAVPAIAQQNDEKSAIELKTRAAEITVTIGHDLKVYPGLEADLLAEGRKYAASKRAEAEHEYKADPSWFKENGGRRWTYDLVYSFRSNVADRYISVVQDDGTFTGGAHRNTAMNTILWDAEAKKRISVRPFFKETADNGPTMRSLTKLVRRAVAVAKLARWKESEPDDERSKSPPTPENFAETNPEIVNGVQPKLLKIGPISFAPSTEAHKSSGLTFHFSAYDVDAYAAGPYTVFVPWSALKPYLSAEGERIFGGERPKKDEEQQ